MAVETPYVPTLQKVRYTHEALIDVIIANPAISQRAGIRGIPALVLYRRGREVARLAGARPAADIVAFVQGHMAAKA